VNKGFYIFYINLLRFFRFYGFIPREGNIGNHCRLPIFLFGLRARLQYARILIAENRDKTDGVAYFG